MNLKQKLTYMALGGLFTLIGYTLATLNTNVTAQSEPTVVDEIVCRKLRIVDAQDRTVAVLATDDIYDVLSIYSKQGPKVIKIGRDSNGGYIGVNHRSGQRAATMGIGDKHNEGFIGVEAKDGKGIVQLHTNENGGYIQMRDQQNKSNIQLEFDKYGGALTIFNKGGENVLQASVGDMGGGIISTRDKNGYRTGSLP